MVKMNFSRTTHFKALVEAVSVADYAGRWALRFEIDREISRVYADCQNSLWCMPAGDKTYVYFLRLLRKILRKLTATCGHLSAQNLPSEEGALLKALLLEAEKQAECRIKIVFCAASFSFWRTYASIFEACVQDSRFSVKVVYVPFRQEPAIVTNGMMEPYWQSGVPVEPYTTYDLPGYNPDVVFLPSPNEAIPPEYTLAHISGVVKRVVCSPVILSGSVPDFYFNEIHPLLLTAVCWNFGNNRLDGVEKDSSVLCSCGLLAGDILKTKIYNGIVAEESALG